MADDAQDQGVMDEVVEKEEAAAGAPSNDTSSEPSAAPNAEEGEGYVQYDFTSPALLLREQINTLQIIYESFCQQATSSLTTYLGSECTFTFKDIDQCFFHQYINDLAAPNCFGVFDLQPLSGQALFQADDKAFQPIVLKMLGGDKGEDDADVNRPFTDLELAVVQKLFKVMLRSMKEAWDNAIDLSFSLLEVQTKPSMAKVVPSHELCAIVNIEVTYGEVSGNMSVCIPFLYLEPIADRLVSDCLGRKHNTHLDKSVWDVHEKNFKRIEFDVAALLGEVELSMQELLYLSEGDILSLHQRVEDPVDVRVGGVSKFTGSPGLMGLYRAVQIAGTVEKDSDQ